MPQRNGVLVVTGGSRGIGAATCVLGAERGYAVVVNYTSNVEAAERICARIHQQGGEAVAVRGDVSQPDDIEHIFKAADRLGTLTGLVNNAGMIFPDARLDEMDASRIAHSFAVNVTGTCCRPAGVPPRAPDTLTPATAPPGGNTVGVAAARLMVSGDEADDG